MQRDGARGIIIAPHWPAQPQFPLYHALRVSPVVYLQPAPNLLLSPCRTLRPLGALRDVDSRAILTSFHAAGFAIGHHEGDAGLSNAEDRPTIQWYLWKWWMDFSTKNHLDPYKGTTLQALAFLTEMFPEAAQYGSLSSARSALNSLFLFDLARDFAVLRIFKGVYRLRPPKLIEI